MNRNVTSAILLVLAVAVYLTFTSPTWAETKTIKEKNKVYLEAIKNTETLIQTRDKVLGDYNALSAEDQDRLSKMLPTVVDNIRLIVDLNSVALKRGLTIRNIKAIVPTVNAAPTQSSTQAGTTVKDPELGSVTISFNVNTTYQQFMQFMRDLEQNLRIMDISHLTIKTSNTSNYDYSVELKTYWLAQ